MATFYDTRATRYTGYLAGKEGQANYYGLHPTENAAEIEANQAKQMQQISDIAKTTRNVSGDLIKEFQSGKVSLEDIQNRLQTGTGGAGSVYDPTKGPMINTGGGFQEVKNFQTSPTLGGGFSGTVGGQVYNSQSTTPTAQQVQQQQAGSVQPTNQTGTTGTQTYRYIKSDGSYGTLSATSPTDALSKMPADANKQSGVQLVTSSGGASPTELANQLDTSGGTTEAAGTSTASRQAESMFGSFNPPAQYNSAEEYQRLRIQQGVSNDEGELSALQNDIKTAKEALNQFKQTSTREINMESYLGGISEAERNLNFRLETLSLQEQAVVDRLNYKNSTINTIISLGEKDYEQTYKAYTDEYDRNLKVTQLYNEQLEQEKKDSLTAFTTTYNLLQDSGATITPQLSTQMDTLALKAGLPTGVFQSAMQGLSSTNEKILAPIMVENSSGGKDVYFYTQGKDGTPHLKAVKSISGGTIGGISNISTVGTGVGELTNFISSNKIKFNDKDSSALGVILALDDFAKYNPEGQFEGINPIARLPGRFQSEEGRRNRQFVEAINLTTQQWASGAALTEAQTRQVQKLTPDKNDTDSQVRDKINGLANYMLTQLRATAIKSGRQLPANRIRYDFSGVSDVDFRKMENLI